MRVLKVIGGLIVLFVVVRACVPGGTTTTGSDSSAASTTSSDAADTQSASSAASDATLQTVDVKVLFAAYKANEVAADNVFKNKRFKVTGAVDSINKDFTDDVYLQLQGGGMFETVDARGISATDAASLQKGQTVTVACTGNGMLIGTPQLRNCSLQ